MCLLFLVLLFRYSQAECLCSKYTVQVLIRLYVFHQFVLLQKISLLLIAPAYSPGELLHIPPG